MEEGKSNAYIDIAIGFTLMVLGWQEISSNESKLPLWAIFLGFVLTLKGIIYFLTPRLDSKDNLVTE